MKKITYLLLLFMPMIACNPNADNSANNSNTQNAANEQRMMEFYQSVMNEHNMNMIDSFCSPDFLDHQPFPGYEGNLEGIKKGFADMISAFPDMSIDVLNIKSWNDTVMAQIRMKGTNSNSFMGAPATNKSFDVEGVDIVVIKDGKAREHWGYMEEMKMMNQLGMGGQEPPAEAGSEQSAK